MYICISIKNIKKYSRVLKILFLRVRKNNFISHIIGYVYFFTHYIRNFVMCFKRLQSVFVNSNVYLHGIKSIKIIFFKRLQSIFANSNV